MRAQRPKVARVTFTLCGVTPPVSMVKESAVSRAKKSTVATRFFVWTRFLHTTTVDTALHIHVATRTAAYIQAQSLQSCQERRPMQGQCARRRARQRIGSRILRAL